MTFKKFWKRVTALLHDNRTVLREGEDIEDWEEVRRKQRDPYGNLNPRLRYCLVQIDSPSRRKLFQFAKANWSGFDCGDYRKTKSTTIVVLFIFGEVDD